MKQIEILKNKLDEISSSIENNHLKNNQSGVLAGISGIAIFSYYYSRFSNNEYYEDLGLKALTLCVDNINNGNVYPTYCSGIAGLGWVFQHLTKNDLVEVDDRLLNDLDEYLYESMSFYIKNGNYDFLHGGLGCGFYFLKRYENTSSKDLKNKYKNYLYECVGLLKDLSEATNDTVKWESIIDIETKEKGYNLSLSHGMSSIVNFLSRLYHYDDFKDRVEGMLKGGVNYILSHKSEDKNSLSLFPNYIKLNEKVQRNSRLAWCYGDLGIGLSLWKASKALKDGVLEKESIDILKHTSGRRLPENTMVSDAGLCHGSFGNAQIFNYMFRQTKIEEFKNATYS